MIRLLSILSTLLPIIFFLVNKDFNREKKLWVVFINCWLSLLLDLSYRPLLALKESLEFDIYSFYTFIEYSLIAVFFYLTYKTLAFKRAVIICSALFYLIVPLSIIYYRNLNFDPLTFTTEAVFVVVFTIMYFYEQINDPNITFVYGTKSFWIIIGFLLYTAVGLFPYVTKPFLDAKEYKLLSPIPFMANILKNILFTISFRMLPQGRKQ